jgi:hypothetical protein
MVALAAAKSAIKAALRVEDDDFTLKLSPLRCSWPPSGTESFKIKLRR